MSRVSGVSARMSRGCYEETDSVEFKLTKMPAETVCATLRATNEVIEVGYTTADEDSHLRCDTTLRKGKQHHTS